MGRGIDMVISSPSLPQAHVADVPPAKGANDQSATDAVTAEAKYGRARLDRRVNRRSMALDLAKAAADCPKPRTTPCS